jgi:hypothetical protein
VMVRKNSYANGSDDGAETQLGCPPKVGPPEMEVPR